MKTRSLAGFSLLICLMAAIVFSCSNSKSGKRGGKGNEAGEYEQGSNYQVYKRIRILDKHGFEEPVEAWSLLLPDGWKHKGKVEWISSAEGCEGTFISLKASSEDGEYSFEIFPNTVYNTGDYTENEKIFGRFSCAKTVQPMDAEQYLTREFAEELDNPTVVKVVENEEVVSQIQKSNTIMANERMRSGAGETIFSPSAINARLKWENGKEGFAIIGLNSSVTAIPDNYTGATSTLSMTNILKRMVFKYPKGERKNAEALFAVIVSSIRTNIAWQKAVDRFWGEMRKLKEIGSRQQIAMTDELTRSMARETIRRGNERLAQMDVDLRNWEMTQSSQDRMHTNFVKAIREVENYQDETGKYEMTSAYDHAWSRGDGKTFVMSNDPNFDPGFVFQDQSWKEMKRVD